VRYFLAFLLAHAVLCLYGGVLLAHVLYAIVTAENLFLMFVRDESGALVPIGYAIALRWLVHQHAPLVGLCFALIMISVVLLCFFGYHVSLVFCNTTTNETFKWQDLRRQIRYKRKQAAKQSKAAADAAVADAAPAPDPAESAAGRAATEPGDGGDAAQNGAADRVEEDESGDESKLRSVDRMEDLVNHYNRGPVSNFREAAFPAAALAAARRRRLASLGTAALGPVTPANGAAGGGSSSAKTRGGGMKSRGKAGKGSGAAEAEELLQRVQKLSNSLKGT
jgi:hypothetical protein